MKLTIAGSLSTLALLAFPLFSSASTSVDCAKKNTPEQYRETGKVYEHQGDTCGAGICGVSKDGKGACLLAKDNGPANPTLMEAPSVAEAQANLTDDRRRFPRDAGSGHSLCNNFLERVLAIGEWYLAQIDTVQMQDVERPHAEVMVCAGVENGVILCPRFVQLDSFSPNLDFPYVLFGGSPKIIWYIRVPTGESSIY